MGVCFNGQSFFLIDSFYFINIFIFIKNKNFFLFLIFWKYTEATQLTYTLIFRISTDIFQYCTALQIAWPLRSFGNELFCIYIITSSLWPRLMQPGVNMFTSFNYCKSYFFLLLNVEISLQIDFVFSVNLKTCKKYFFNYNYYIFTKTSFTKICFSI